MAPVVYIQDIDRYVGQEVTLRGWLYSRTDKGKLQFLQVRDGTGFIQCVVFQKEVPESVFAAATRLTQESSLIVTGIVRQDPRAPGVPGGYELGVTDLQVIQIADEYPIQPKEHGVDFLLDHRHLWIRSRRQWAILRVRATVIRAIRDWLDSHGFINLDTPILTPAACEGTTTLFQTDYFGEPAYLSQSGQLYNEANIYAFGRVYCFGPTFRAEKSKTRRHLTEFWMVEPEIAFCDLEQLMEIEEQLVTYIVQTCLRERARELALLERDTRPLEKVEPPFPRISYDEALELLAQIREETEDENLKELLKIEWGSDFGSPHETELTKRFEKPVFVYGYPTKAKAFYMEPWPGRPEVCKSVDLLAPEGYGEITGGSERISDPDLLIQRLKEWNLPREAFEWYIDLRRYGSVPHSGFGLGVERTVAWICGIDHLREAIPFPRTLKRVYP
ncbi:MAG: asparagine--tRNA ligase [Anaerolineae bacterium]|nr:asparagine--tRNA ligase [Anaerolineae bacterium]MCX8067025.1 asparagine--tRNA ligase [Anaerolineae bacterium]MDW7991806.1 asparagine--tRNA ligase [Anaerolineae bacterium]